MSTATRTCPSCVAALPADAVFCHKCGTATPMEIVAATGEVHAGDVQEIEEAARRSALQQALGENYDVRRLLGRGGFAEVYVAWDKRLKREIAVKTIRGDLVVNDSLLERFQREAEAVAKLRHPNIVPIYAVGESNGIAYFTMPLIEGQSLADVIGRDGRVPLDETIRIMREAAMALHAAHRIGLVHRDIKPENIMLEGPERSAIVMDFGIAKTEGSEGKGLTGTGMLVGTPQYMSPEQAVGERSLGAGSDQYSLAMVGYRMLTGRLPFESDSIQTLIFKTVTSVPPLATEVAPDVPRAISDVLAKALSKRSEDRYESMAAFATALGQTQSGAARIGTTSGSFRSTQPNLAARVQSSREAMPTVRHPLVWVAIVATIGGLLAGTRTKSPAGVALAANRAEAVFAARNFLKERGVASPGAADPSFSTRDAVLEYLQRTLTSDSTEKRAATDAPVWRWSIDFGKITSDSDWTIDVGPDNRIVGFRHRILDSAQGPTISHDSARVLAEHEIEARGWTRAAIEPTRDSTITRKHRVDHLFRWRKKADAIAWKGSDSAYVEIRAGVNGAAVTDYSIALKTPDSYQTDTNPKTPFQFISAIGITILVVMGLFAFVFLTTRQRVDELQWKMGARILAAACVCLVPAAIPAISAASSGTSAALLTLLFSTIGFGFLLACGLLVTVISESLAAQENPKSVLGLDELSRARSLPPEAIASTVWGYMLAGIAVGAMTLLRLAASTLFGDRFVGGTVNSVFGFTWPSVYVLVMLGASMIGVFVVLYLIAVSARWKLTAPLAMYVPALLTSLIMIVKGHTGSVLVNTVFLFLVGYAAWKHGVVAGIIVLWVPDAIDAAFTLIRAPGADTMTAGVFTIAVLFIPLVAALIARPRMFGAAVQRTSTEVRTL